MKNIFKILGAIATFLAVIGGIKYILDKFCKKKCDDCDFEDEDDDEEIDGTVTVDETEEEEEEKETEE